RRLHRLNRRVMELLDDVGRRALWKKDGVPGIGLEIGRPLLETGRHVRERGGALLCHDRDRLHRPAVDLRFGGANNLAEGIYSAALPILHSGAGGPIRAVGGGSARGGLAPETTKTGATCRPRRP